MKLFLSLFLAWPAFAAIVSLPYDAKAADRFRWRMSPETNVLGYMLLWGPRSQGPYTATNIISGRLNTNGSLTLPIGFSFVVVQAYSDKLISGYSNEVISTNLPPVDVPLPPAPPLMLEQEQRSTEK